MKKLLCLILSMPMFIWAVAQESESHVHVVQRGESLERIATMYGTTVEELYRHNQFLNNHFYVGQKLNVPVEVLSGNELTFSENRPLVEERKQELADIHVYMKDAEALEFRKKYSKANKIYTNCLKEFGENAYIHYRMGRCYYLRGKWKKSILELRKAVNSKDLSPEIDNEVRDLLAQATDRREEQLERRSEMWSAIGASLATTVAVTANAFVQAKTSSSTSTRTSSTSYGSSGSGSSSYSSGSSSSSGSVSSSSSKRCSFCLGSGKCKTCNGKGTYYPEGFGLHELTDCPNCSDGTCSHCHGSGTT